MNNFSGGVYVIKRRGETIEQLIKKFRKKYMKNGILIDIREKMYYVKPSKKKKKKKEIARKRRLREERKLSDKKLNRRKRNDTTIRSKRQDSS